MRGTFKAYYLRPSLAVGHLQFYCFLSQMQTIQYLLLCIFNQNMFLLSLVFHSESIGFFHDFFVTVMLSKAKVHARFEFELWGYENNKIRYTLHWFELVWGYVKGNYRFTQILGLENKPWIRKMHVIGTVRGPLLMQKSPTCAYLSQKPR